MNARIGQGTAIHSIITAPDQLLTGVGSIRGSKGRLVKGARYALCEQGKRGRRSLPGRPTDAEVTCKRCLRLLD